MLVYAIIASLIDIQTRAAIVVTPLFCRYNSITIVIITNYYNSITIVIITNSKVVSSCKPFSYTGCELLCKHNNQ